MPLSVVDEVLAVAELLASDFGFAGFGVTSSTIGAGSR